MKRIAAIAIAIMLCVALLSGCAIITGVKKYFCALPVNALVTQFRANIQDINANYNTYVIMLQGGDQTVRPWVVAADTFLAQAYPMVEGMQQGVCYAATMIENAIKTYQAAKAAEVK
jgi:hypothetical protein